jgi:hypothetical protein
MSRLEQLGTDEPLDLVALGELKGVSRNTLLRLVKAGRIEYTNFDGRSALSQASWSGPILSSSPPKVDGGQLMARLSRADRAILERVHKRGGVKDFIFPTIIRYLEAVERLDPSIVRDAIAELNRNEYALGRISGRPLKRKGPPIAERPEEPERRAFPSRQQERLRAFTMRPFVALRQTTERRCRRAAHGTNSTDPNSECAQEWMTRRSSMIEIV